MVISFLSEECMAIHNQYYTQSQLEGPNSDFECLPPLLLYWSSTEAFIVYMFVDLLETNLLHGEPLGQCVLK